MALMGKWLMVLGLAAFFIGLLFYFFPDKTNWIGRLPGDVRFQNDHFRFYFPITTLLLINLLIWLILRIWRWLQ